MDDTTVAAPLGNKFTALGVAAVSHGYLIAAGSRLGSTFLFSTSSLGYSGARSSDSSSNQSRDLRNPELVDSHHVHNVALPLEDPDPVHTDSARLLASSLPNPLALSSNPVPSRSHEDLGMPTVLTPRPRFFNGNVLNDISSLNFSHHGSYLAVASHGAVVTWDTVAQSECARLACSSCHSVAYSASDEHILSTCAGNSEVNVNIWDVRNSQNPMLALHTRAARAKWCSWHPFGIVTLSSTDGVRLYDLRMPDLPRAHISTTADNPLLAMHPSPNPSWPGVATADRSGRIQLWNLGHYGFAGRNESVTSCQVITHVPHVVQSLRFSLPDANALVLACSARHRSLNTSFQVHDSFDLSLCSKEDLSFSLKTFDVLPLSGSYDNRELTIVALFNSGLIRLIRTQSQVLERCRGIADPLAFTEPMAVDSSLKEMLSNSSASSIGFDGMEFPKEHQLNTIQALGHASLESIKYGDRRSGAPVSSGGDAHHAEKSLDDPSHSGLGLLFSNPVSMEQSGRKLGKAFAGGESPNIKKSDWKSDWEKPLVELLDWSLNDRSEGMRAEPAALKTPEMRPMTDQTSLDTREQGYTCDGRLSFHSSQGVVSCFGKRDSKAGCSNTIESLKRERILMEIIENDFGLVHSELDVSFSAWNHSKLKQIVRIHDPFVSPQAKALLRRHLASVYNLLLSPSDLVDPLKGELSDKAFFAPWEQTREGLFADSPSLMVDESESIQTTPVSALRHIFRACMTNAGVASYFGEHETSFCWRVLSSVFEAVDPCVPCVEQLPMLSKLMLIELVKSIQEMSSGDLELIQSMFCLLGAGVDSSHYSVDGVRCEETLTDMSHQSKENALFIREIVVPSTEVRTKVQSRYHMKM